MRALLQIYPTYKHIASRYALNPVAEIRGGEVGKSSHRVAILTAWSHSVNRRVASTPERCGEVIARLRAIEWNWQLARKRYWRWSRSAGRYRPPAPGSQPA